MTTKTATSMLPNPLKSSKITEEGATANQEPAQTQEIECQALLDSGSIAGNFINNDLLLQLNGRNKTYKTTKPLQVCSGLDNHCLPSTEVIDIQVEFLIKNIKKFFYNNLSHHTFGSSEPYYWP
jgi:hypothetical protein